MRPNHPYIDENGQWKSERNLALQHRVSMHDYKKPGIYMITLCVNNRYPLFGRLVMPQAIVEPTSVGLMVEHTWREIPIYNPEITVLDFQLMPDHLHGLIRVNTPLTKPLGQIIRGYKMRCTSLYRALMHDEQVIPLPNEGKASLTIEQRKQVASQSLWERDYNDRIAYTKQRIDTLRAYIHDNPRRLALKKQHPEYFALMQNIHIPTSSGILTFTTMGNSHLLEASSKQVLQCSRSLTDGHHESEYRALMHNYIERAKSGMVIISAAISKGEQMICRAIREQGLPLVILIKDGFPSPNDPRSTYYKPRGALFEACSKGHLLLMEPSEDTFLIDDITHAVNLKSPMAPPESNRYRFLSLNVIASLLAGGTVH